MRTIEIKVLSGISSGDVFTYQLSTGDSVKLGRADSNELVLSDPRISRTHCGFLAREDAVYIYDLGSAAGTFHMGFQLKAGEAGARALNSGDEFKIGDSLFRVQISGEPTIEENADVISKSSLFSKQAPRKKHVIYAGLVLVLLPLLLFLFLGDSGSKKSLPKQSSHVVIDLPSYRMIGYWPGGRSTPSHRKDNSHLDKAKFYLPATHHLIEYDYISEVPILVEVDGVEVETLQPYTAAWRKKQILVRDVAQGIERVLVFDNKDYPTQKNRRKHKRWAVRNVRVTPIERPLEASVEEAISKASALADDFDKKPEGLFVLVRALQRVALELLIDHSADLVPVSISRGELEDEFDELDAAEVTETLDAIVSERVGEYQPDMDTRHLSAVVSLISRFDSELWRRVNSRFRQAKHSAQAKNSIVVYDNLVAIKTMFPDETDYRWVRANRMLNDKKYVPKKVRRNPGRYRR